MSNIVPLQNHAADFQPRELALIKRTVAADTNTDEFDLFISYCRALQLDPRRRQIYALVYSKNKPDKRKMSIIVGIDGFRSVAARSGCYRADDEEPRFEYDAEAKSPTNPLGLVKAVVKVWQFSHGQWFPVTASAYWEEYAPIKEEWAWDDNAGKNKPTGKKTLDGKWPQMPRLMLAKVAEALALRKAWPGNFSNVYAAEEMDRANVLDLTASEAAAHGEQETRMERIGGGNSILVDWLDNSTIQPVPVGAFADRVAEFIDKHKEEPSQLMQFSERNRHALREFWAKSPGDALEVKKMLEAAATAHKEQA